MSSSQPLIHLSTLALPQLGLGVWKTPADETAAIVAHAAQSGYRAIDTATIYKNEQGVGDGLADHPEIVLTTKLWNEDQGYDNALRAFEASAARLRRDVIDLYLIHWPSPKRDLYVESWRALIRLQQEGRVKAIGVSNFEAEHLDRIIRETGVTPAVNQIELHPDFQQRRLRATHQKLGIQTQSWSPLGQGKIINSPEIAEIAYKHGKTSAQVIIRWHLQNGLIVIPKSANPERIAENIAVFDFELDDSDLAKIAALDTPDGRIGPDPLTAEF